MKLLKKLLVCGLACVVSFSVTAAAGNNGKGNGNSGNSGNQSVQTTTAPSYPLHQGEGPHAWQPYLQGSDFGINEKKGEDAFVPGYELGTEGTVFWHFVNPDKLGGYANITFIDEAGLEHTFEGVMSYKNDQHFAVVTDQSWKLMRAEYFPATAPKKGSTQFNLSHTSGTIVAKEGALAVTVDAQKETLVNYFKETVKQDIWKILERDVWGTFEQNVWDIYERDVWKIFEQDVWDIYERDVWNILEREVWDIYERDVWDIYEQDVWDVVSKEFWKIYEREIWDIYEYVSKSYVKPVITYEKKIMTSSADTLTSWRNDGTIPGGEFNNGMMYLQLDVDTARNEGYTFGIATSGKGATPNAYQGYDYFVNIVGDQLIISFDDRFIQAIEVTAKVYNTAPEKHDNSTHIAMYTGDTYVVDLPAGYGDTVYLYTHFNKGVKWYATSEWEQVGDIQYVPCFDHEDAGIVKLEQVGSDATEYAFVKRVYGEWVKVGEGASGYVKTGSDATEYDKTGSDATEYVETGKGASEWDKTGAGESGYEQTGKGATAWEKTGTGASGYVQTEGGASDYVRTGFGSSETDRWTTFLRSETDTEYSVVATFDLVVANAEGEIVFNGTIKSGANGGATLPKLAEGEYTVTLSYNGEILDIQDVTVVVGDTASVDFAGIVINGGSKDVIEYTRTINNCVKAVRIDNDVDAVYKDNEIADVYKCNKVADVYKDNAIADVYKCNKVADVKIDNPVKDEYIDNAGTDEYIDNAVENVKEGCFHNEDKDVYNTNQGDDVILNDEDSATETEVICDCEMEEICL